MTISFLKGRRVLVVGAGGFLGSHIVRALHKARATVLALDLFRPTTSDQKTVWYVGSAQDESFVSSVVAGCDAVIYVAGYSLPATANADMAAEINGHVRTAVKTAEICDRMGVGRFIFASSGGTVYGRSFDTPIREDAPTLPKNAYGASKLACEHYLRILGNMRSISTLSLRISNPYGEGQTANRGQGFIAAVIEKMSNREQLQVWGDGSVIRDFIYAGDVAQAFVKACSYNGPAEVINIGTGVGHSLAEVIRLVEQEAGRSLDVDHKSGRAIDVPYSVLDVSKARELLDWTPATSLEAGVKRTCMSCGLSARRDVGSPSTAAPRAVQR